MSKPYVGVDVAGYPGNPITDGLRASGVSVICFYLAHQDIHASSWTNAVRQHLATKGWGFIPTYSGYKANDDGSIEIAGQNLPFSALTGPLGVTQAAHAVTWMQDAGFPTGSVIYLDLESGDPLRGDYLKYATSWMATVAAHGFVAGIYCTGGALASVKQLPWPGKPLIWLASPDNAWANTIDLGQPLPIYQLDVSLVGLQGKFGVQFEENGKPFGPLFDYNMFAVTNPADYSGLVQEIEVANIALAAELVHGDDEQAEAAAYARSIAQAPHFSALNALDSAAPGADESWLESEETVAQLVSRVRKAAIYVLTDPSPENIAIWLQIMLQTTGVASETFDDISLDLLNYHSDAVSAALSSMSQADELRALVALTKYGDTPVGDALSRIAERRAPPALAAALVLAAPTTLQFVGQKWVSSGYGQKMIAGTLTIPDGAPNNVFAVDNGGVGKTYRQVGGPLPPGGYAVSGPFAPAPGKETQAMTRDGVAFKFILTADPASVVRLPSGGVRTGFCIHPDGNLPGTEGCIGLVENAAGLDDLRDRLTQLIVAARARGGTVKLTADYTHVTPWPTPP